MVAEAGWAVPTAWWTQSLVLVGLLLYGFMSCSKRLLCSHPCLA